MTDLIQDKTEISECPVTNETCSKKIQNGESINSESMETGVAIEVFKDVIARLRDTESGCRWDKAQTFESLKPCVVEEAAEVVSGINIFTETGDADNLKEELGDLLMQVVMYSQLAEEQELFTLKDVTEGITAKMLRRHPHVFHVGDPENGDLEELIQKYRAVGGDGQPLTTWAEIKAQEKQGKEWTEAYLPAAFDEAEDLIQTARERKKAKMNKKQV